MGDITIGAGETIELVSPGDTREYEVEITTGEVRFATSMPQAESGRIRYAGDRGICRNTKGDGVYAHSEDGATLAMDDAAFSLALYGESQVVSAGERSARQGLDYSQNQQTSIPDGGASTQLIGVTNTTDQTWYCSYAGWTIEGTYTDSIAVYIVKFDEESNIELELPTSVSSGYVQFQPVIAVDPNEQLNINCQNYSGAAVTMEGSLRYQEVIS